MGSLPTHDGILMRQTMISTAYLTKRSGTTFADLVGETMELVNDFYRIPHKAVLQPTFPGDCVSWASLSAGE